MGWEKASSLGLCLKALQPRSEPVRGLKKEDVSSGKFREMSKYKKTLGTILPNQTAAVKTSMRPARIHVLQLGPGREHRHGVEAPNVQA